MGVLSADVNAYVMGFFLSLSILNVWENGLTCWTRRTKVDIIQFISSVCQIMNLIVHMIMNTALYLDCNWATNAETIFFYIMQLGCGFVIIYRGTHVIRNENHCLWARIILTIILSTSVGFNLASDILRDMLVIEGVCIPIFQRFLNDVAKAVLAFLYVILLFVFTVPVYRRLKGVSNFVDTSAVQVIAITTALKIIFAILVMLATVVCSFYGVFGAYFWVQFTIQNYAMIWCSTVALRPNQGSTFSASKSSRRGNSSDLARSGGKVSVNIGA
ncbi:hypothetical protein HK102_013042 [Quaeritorhiza haematococci]|nr:hypothetical protein HK102_013042 [Quaeritorhiza haematococci]